MSYIVYDTSTLSTATCQQLTDAINAADLALREEERKGHRVEQEAEGRWAVYDGEAVGLVWIEAESGDVVAFSR